MRIIEVQKAGLGNNFLNHLVNKDLQTLSPPIIIKDDL